MMVMDMSHRVTVKTVKGISRKRFQSVCRYLTIDADDTLHELRNKTEVVRYQHYSEPLMKLP